MRVLFPLLLLAILSGCHGGPRSCGAPPPSADNPSTQAAGSPSQPTECKPLATQAVESNCPAPRCASAPYPPPAQKVVIEVVHKHEKPPCEKAPCVVPPATTAAPAPPQQAMPVQMPMAGYPAASYAAGGVPGTMQFVTTAPRQRTGLGLVFDVFRIPIPVLRPAIVTETETPTMMAVQPVSYAPAAYAPAYAPAAYAPPVAAPIAAAPPVAAAPQQYVDVPLVGTGRVPVQTTNLAPAVGVCPPCPPATASPSPATPTRAEIDELTRSVRDLASQVRQQQKRAPDEE